MQGASHRIAEAFRRRRYSARQTSCDRLQALLKVLDERGEFLLSLFFLLLNIMVTYLQKAGFNNIKQVSMTIIGEVYATYCKNGL